MIRLVVLSRSDHPAMLTGTFSSALPGSPHMVTRGKFGLFTTDDRTPDTRNLVYNFDMVGTDGSVLNFYGYKVVDNGAAFSVLDIWRETSTLFVIITKPSDKSIVGRGILKIEKSDFAAELLTFNVQGHGNIISKAGTMGRFLGYFSKNLARVFFAPLVAFRPSSPPSGIVIGSKRPPSESFTVTATDGVVSAMNAWEPTNVSAGEVHDILFIPGASVDERIFALPTIPTNAIEYFTRAGYRCYSVTHRIGLSPNAKDPRNWTAFDARLDVKAALNEVYSRNGGKKVYVVAHCAGSIALACGLLDGSIPGSEQIRAITASNVFMHPILDTVNRAKAMLPLPWFYSKVSGTTWFDCVPQPGLVQRLLDQALRFYPVGSKVEICSSPVCRRADLAFGRLWTHKNLNAATHDAFGTLLGGATVRNLEHLVEMGNQKVVLTSDLKPLLTPPPVNASALDVIPRDQSLERLRGIPILLFSGSENAVYEPEGTDRCYSLLRSELDPDHYERVVFVGRGHLDCWMSPTSSDDGDVFATVLAHADAICRRDAMGTNADGGSVGQRIIKCAAASA